MSCWCTWEEWKTVQTNVIETLSQPNSTNITQTLTLLKIWQSRQILPVQIEATIGVLQSIQSHVETPELFPSIAGFTIIRFVNGIVDAPQKMGSYHRSAYQMAIEQNLPTVLVEIRHSLSHGVIPNTTELVSAIKLVSEYLILNYWKLGGIETNRIWLELFTQIIKSKKQIEIEKCIRDGIKHISTSSLLEISPLIVHYAQFEGEYADKWKDMITRLCGRKGFNDVFLVGITKEFCRRMNDITTSYEQWIVYCISELECNVDDILFLLKNNGVIFEQKSQQLLKKLSPILTGKTKRIVDSFIINDHLKLNTVERNEMEMYIDSQMQMKEYQVGNWNKVSDRPYVSASNEYLIIDPSVQLMSMN